MSDESCRRTPAPQGLRGRRRQRGQQAADPFLQHSIRSTRAREEFERAIGLDPDDVTSNFWYGLALVKSGYRAAGIARFDHALAVDPMMPNVVRWRGIMYHFDGDNARAEQFLNRDRSLGLPLADRELAEFAHQRGDNATAA